MHVLLVDDDQATLNVLDFTLTLDGHRVTRASNGQEGLVLARLERPDLVIIDSMMPVMDGLEAVRRLRQDLGLNGMPILMLTAKALGQDVWAGWQAGIDSYVTKPLDIEVLRAEIERICGVEAA